MHSDLFHDIQKQVCKPIREIDSLAIMRARTSNTSDYYKDKNCVDICKI